MTTISARMIAHSKHALTGKEIATLLLRYPRWIHAEGRTHRQIDLLDGFSINVPTPSLMEDDNLSRNASSSRAIPVNKLIQDVLDDPAEPLYWGKNQKGMQAREELAGSALAHAKTIWRDAMAAAVQEARNLANLDVHKQIVNRLLEPFSHITVVVTATEWSNFLALRDHPDAEPHIAMLARAIKPDFATSKPQELQPDEWHLPFLHPYERSEFEMYGDRGIEMAIKVSVARCASTSYKTVDGFDMTIERAIDLHDKLVAATPLHASPCEHQAYADSTWTDDDGEACEVVYDAPEMHGNFVGWCQYRKTLANECL